MHVSLDSALGRQRRLNSVGESVLQIAPSAAAAYSLRSLTGGDPKVVRVRRGSDNHEQDFTASEVSSGALTSFVNAQVVAPLDIQALTATGRDGDFLIAKAAYSLRSLGTRQATLAATGDTVARADGKFVVQVRRSSDDALKSFTATEVTDGTLLSFVGTGGSDNGFVSKWYDQSVSDQAGAATGNHAVQGTAASQPKIVNAGSLNTSGGLEFDGSDDFFSLTSSFSFQNKAGCVFSLQDGQSSSNNFTAGTSNNNRGIGFRNIQTRWYYTTGAIDIDHSISVSGETLFTALHDGTTNNPNVTAFIDGSLAVDASPDANQGEVNVSTAVDQIGARQNLSFLTGTVKEIIIYDTDQTDNRTAIEANIGEAYSIDLPSGVDPGFDQVDGFVETWYDQSGKGRDSINTTAAQQPIIVEAGVFQDGLKFTHTDTTNGKRLFVPRTAAELGQAFALVYVGKVTESDTSYNNLLGGTRGVQGYAVGTAGISIKSSDGTIAFINETATDARVVSTSSTTATLNEDFVAFATYEDAEAGPELTLQVDAGNQTFSFGSAYVTTSTKDIGIMNATAGTTSGYRTQESPTGICREVLVYDTHQGDNRAALVTNINSQYNLF
jgi:hypothetical protein